MAKKSLEKIIPKEEKKSSLLKLSPRFKKISFIVLDAILILLIFLLAAYLILEKKFDNRIYSNVYLGEINLSGLDRDEAESLLVKELNRFDVDGVEIVLNNRSLVWYNNISSFDPDLASKSVVFEVSDTVNNAYLVARDGSFWEIFNKFKTLFSRTEISLEYFLDKNKVKKIIQENFSDLENPMKNASLNFRDNPLSLNSDIEFYIEEEDEGREIDYDLFFSEFENSLSYLKNDKINLNLVNTFPVVKQADILGLEGEAQDLFEKYFPFNLHSRENRSVFKVTEEEFASWFKVEKKSEEIGSDFNYYVTLNFDAVSDFFDEEIAPKVNREALRPHIEMEGEKVSVFEPGRDGLNLNYQESFSAIKEAFISGDMTDIDLILEVESIEKVSDSNDLGIVELIGSGHSNFSGSPANRRHNIKVGADKLHGMIIKPGEEFSLVSSIGRVNRETGYLPELVIKGNRTIPEYGGGLCQIATTMFRSALGTGLPITERRNHSYRVVYYEPAGTDASMYNPRPDLKFINDTGNNILIQARYEGLDDIHFDFWGKSDGRIATTTYPVIYNIIQPGPTQIIETTDLAPGERKCTERAIAGADAYFDYIVTYNANREDEEVVEKRFYSKYVPWREVCLVGVEPEAENDSGEENELEEGVENGEDVGGSDEGDDI